MVDSYLTNTSMWCETMKINSFHKPLTLMIIMCLLVTNFGEIVPEFLLRCHDQLRTNGIESWLHSIVN